MQTNGYSGAMSTGMYGGGDYRDRRTRDQQQQLGARSPFPNYKTLFGVDGPWNHRPLKGNLFEAMASNGNSQKGGAPSSCEFKRAEYKYVNHPVFLYHENCCPSGSSQRTYEKMIRQLRDERLVGGADQFDLSQIVAFSSSSGSESSGGKKDDLFATGNVSHFAYSRDQNRLTKMRDAASAAAPVVSELPAAGSSSDLSAEASSSHRAPPSPFGQHAAHADAAATAAKIEPHIYYHVCITVPINFLKAGASHLLDFDTSREEAWSHAILVSFMCKAMADMNVGVTEQRRRESPNIPETHFAWCGSLVRRVRFFVEAVLRDDRFNKFIEPDPESIEKTAKYKCPDASKMHEIFRMNNLVAYRLHWYVYDPTFHPCTAIKTRIWWNAHEKNLISGPTLEMLLRDCVDNRGYTEYKRDCDRKKREKMAEDERKKLEDERKKQQQQQQRHEGEGELELADVPPMEAALNAAQAVAQEANAGLFIEGEDEAAEEEEEEEDEDGRGGGESQAEEASEGEEDDDESPERQEARAIIAPKKGGEGDAAKSRLGEQKKMQRIDPMTELSARRSGEPTPVTYYRLVLSLEDYSRRVVHAYQCAARTEDSRRYAKDGLYVANREELADKSYDLHHAQSKLHYLYTFSFDMSCRVARYYVPGSIGQPSTINSLQGKEEAYFRPPSERASMPLPPLVFEYDSTAALPEVLSMYRVPWSTSAIDEEMAVMTDRRERNNKKILSMQMNGIDVSKYLNRPTKIFNGSNPIECMRTTLPSGDDEDSKQKRAAALSSFANRIALDRMPNHAISRPARFDGGAGGGGGDGEEEEEASQVAKKKRRIDTSIGLLRALPLSRQQSARRGESEDADASDSTVTSSLGNDQILSGKRRTGADESILNAHHSIFAESEAEEKEKTARLRFETLQRASKKLSKRSVGANAPDCPSSGGGGGGTSLGELVEHTTELLRQQKCRDFSQCINNFYQSNDPEERRVLELITKSASSSRVSRSIEQEIQSSFGGSAGGSDRELRQERNELRRLLGDSTGEARQRLASTVVEGDFAILRRQVAVKKLSIMTIVSSFPCKTETDELEEWLKAACMWGFTPPENVRNDPEALGKARERAILEAFTPEREEQYRHDILVRLMRLLMEETAGATFSIMKLGNTSLPDSYTGALLHMEERGGTVFFAPSWTFDSSLSRYSVRFARDMLDINVFCNMHSAHVFLLEMLHSFRVSSFRQAKKMPTNMLYFGAPGSEKSEFMRYYDMMCTGAANVSSDHESRLASVVNKPQDFFNLYYDEAPDWIVGPVEKMSREARETRDRRKSNNTTQSISYQRNEESQAGGREKKSYKVSYIHQIVALTNEISATREKSVLDRFRSVLVCPTLRPGKTLAKKVLASHFEFKDQNEALELMCMQKKDEHCIVAMVSALQNCLALPSPNCELLAVVISEGERDLDDFLPLRPARARESARAFNDCEAYVVGRLYDKYFTSEASPFVEWSRDRTGKVDGNKIDDVTPLQLENLIDFFHAGACAQYPEALLAAKNYFEERFPLKYFEMIYIIASEVCGFVPEFFHASYAEVGIPLIDVKGRAIARGQHRVVGRKSVIGEDGLEREEDVVEGAPEQESVMAEWYALRDRARDAAIRSHPKGPKFATTWQCDMIGFEDENDPVQVRRKQAREAAIGAGKPPPKEAPLYVPSFVVFRGDFLAFVKRSVEVLKQYYESVDENTVKTVLSNIAECNVRYPMYKPEEHPLSDNISFAGVERINGKIVDRERVHAKIVYGNSSPITAASNGKSVGSIRILTHFLLKPWHEAFYMFATAHENEHTRRLDCVLSMQRRDYPDLLHRWSVRPNPSHVLSYDNPKFVPSKVARAMLPLSTDTYSHLLPRHGTITEKALSSRGRDVRDLKEDIELNIFRRHVTGTYYDPPKTRSIGMATDWDLEKDPTKRIQLMIESHSDAPGMTERIIRKIQKEYGLFKAFASLRYPDDIISELQVIDTEREANRRFQTRVGTSRTALSDEEYRILRKWMNSRIEEITDAGEKKTGHEWLSELEYWHFFKKKTAPPSESPESWAKRIEEHKEIERRMLSARGQFPNFVLQYCVCCVHKEKQDEISVAHDRFDTYRENMHIITRKQAEALKADKARVKDGWTLGRTLVENRPDASSSALARRDAEGSGSILGSADSRSCSDDPVRLVNTMYDSLINGEPKAIEKHFKASSLRQSSVATKRALAEFDMIGSVAAQRPANRVRTPPSRRGEDEEQIEEDGIDDDDGGEEEEQEENDDDDDGEEKGKESHRREQDVKRQRTDRPRIKIENHGSP